MNTLEIDAIAQGILNHIKTTSATPLDGVAILGIALCKLYDDGCDDTSALPFTKFASDFHASLLATHKDVSAQGPVTRQ